MWASRDLWMTNVTMHADTDTPSQAVWVDDFGLFEGAQRGLCGHVDLHVHGVGI